MTSTTARWYATTGSDTPTAADRGPYATCEEAQAACRTADLDAVSWLSDDGYYYCDPVEEPEADAPPEPWELYE